ncbi:hypothetical protein [Streptomyces sp. NPDC059076]|uniref:hypothetical protein n=1 Tax=unclassified Streptomyces TaxID=2593676 RepID=UPI0036AC8B73
MAQWNLSVDIRGQGGNLSQALRSNAREARNLAVDVREARAQVRGLGRNSQSSAVEVRSLKDALRSATRNLKQTAGAATDARKKLLKLAEQARGTASELREIASAAALADTSLRAIVDEVHVRARLDDDTATGLASVQASINDLQRRSPVGLTINLDDHTDAGIASVQAALTSLQARNPIRLDVQFSGDSAQVLATATAMGDLHNNADNAGDSLSDLVDDATRAAAALQLVESAAQETSRALRTLRGRAAATATAFDDLAGRATAAATGIRRVSTAANAADGRLTTLSGNTRTLRTDLDDLDGSVTRLAGNMGGLRGRLGTISASTSNASGRTRGLIIAAIGLSTALIPIAAATVPIAAGLGASTVALGAFGIAVGGQISTLAEAAKAQEEYDEAIREHGKASPEAAKAEKELLRQVEQMPPKTREAAAAVSVLKDDYREWSDSLAEFTMDPVIKGLGITNALLPMTTPLVKGTSRELDRMMTVIGGAIQTDEFSRFMQTFTTFAVDSLAQGTTNAVRFARALDTGEIGSDYREFMAYVRANGPIVSETLGDITSAAIHLLVAASDMGVSVLQLLDILAGLVTAVPTEVLSTFLQLYMAFKLVSLGAAALTAATSSSAAASLAAFVRSVRFGGVGPAITGAAAAMSTMAKAGVGLAVLAVAAIGISELAENARGAPPDVDRLTTSLKELSATGQMTGELKKTFGDFDGLIDKMKKLRVETERAGEDGGFEIPGISHFADWIGDVSNDLIKGEDSFKALKEDFRGVDQALAQLVSSGNAKSAAEGFDLIRSAGIKAGLSTKEINDLLPSYLNGVANLKVEQELAAQSMGVFGQQALDTKQKLDSQKASADGLTQAIVALNEANRAALGGQIAFEQALDDTAKAVTEATKASKGKPVLNMEGGKLVLDSQPARDAATALQNLATKTDEAATSARANGALWDEVNQIYREGTSGLVTYGQQFGLTKAEAEALASTILNLDDHKTLTIDMQREDAIAGLDQVIGKIEETPDAKSVTVGVLSSAAVAALQAVGYKVETLPDGQMTVTAQTGTAITNVGKVKAARDGLEDRSITISIPVGSPLTQAQVIQNAINNIRGKSVSILVTTHKRTTYDQDANGTPDMIQAPNARGSIMDFYADGGTNRRGVRENHIAQIAPAGAMRIWAEPETQGEGYVPFAQSKRPRSRAITEEIVRRLGGDPSGIQWNAEGSVTDWRYDPSTGSLYSPSDAGAAGRKTRKVKGKDVAYFDLGAVETRLKRTSDMTRRWNGDLAKVADRVGGDVAEALAAMGTEGYELTKKMANGSTKYINEMAAALRGLAATAKASLTDYTRSLNKAMATDSAFAKNLAILAARGHGDLAAQLAAQGDEAAMQLAASAVGDNKKATAANTAAKTANNALTNEQVQQLVAIIAAVKTSKTGIHDVADTTGLGEDDIIATATKASTQIKSALGSRAAKFLADLARANKGMSYADGGIRPGIYSTRAGAVTFAEPSTGGEGFIPLGANKRRTALPVLRDVAARMGVGLTPLGGSDRYVVIRDGGDTYINVPVTQPGASAADIAWYVGRTMRAARRGGVKARAA